MQWKLFWPIGFYIWICIILNGGITQNWNGHWLWKIEKETFHPFTMDPFNFHRISKRTKNFNKSSKKKFHLLAALNGGKLVGLQYQPLRHSLHLHPLIPNFSSTSAAPKISVLVTIATREIPVQEICTKNGSVVKSKRRSQGDKTPLA